MTPRACAALALLAALAPPAAAAPPASIRVEKKPERVRLGEPFDLELSATYGDRYRLELATATADTGAFLVINAHLEASRTDGDGVTQRIRLTAVAVDVGEQTFPALPWRTVDPWDGTATDVAGPEIAFTVTAEGEVPGKTDPVRDIHGPLRPLDPLLLAALAALLAALAWWLYSVFRRKKERLAMRGAVAARPPHEEALASLDELEASGLWDAGDARGYYLRLSDILRRYLAGRFGVDAPRLTTHDLVRRLRELDLDAAIGVRVRAVCESADLAKFAKARPADERRRSDLAAVRSLVDDTKPVAPKEAVA